VITKDPIYPLHDQHLSGWNVQKGIPAIVIPLSLFLSSYQLINIETPLNIIFKGKCKGISPFCEYD